MQMQIVDTNAGIAIWSEPSRIAGARSLPCSRCQLMFSIATVASSTSMPTASARPPSVMMLMVSPSALSTMIELRIESGIDTAMITVLRQLPRKTRIISAVRQAATSASRSTPEIEACQKRDNPRQRLFDVVDDVERRGVADLLNREQRGARAVDADDVGLWREAVAN